MKMIIITDCAWRIKGLVWEYRVDFPGLGQDVFIEAAESGLVADLSRGPRDPFAIYMNSKYLTFAWSSEPFVIILPAPSFSIPWL